MRLGFETPWFDSHPYFLSVHIGEFHFTSLGFGLHNCKTGTGLL